MNIVKSLKEIVTGKSPEPQIEVAILENCLARGVSMTAGETVTLPQAAAEQLIHSGRAERILTPDDKAKAQRMRDLVPPPWTAAPLPESWQDLPPAFSELWTIVEKFRCARGRAQEIEVLYLRGRGLSDAERLQLESEAGRAAPDGITRSNILENWIHERTRTVLNMTILTAAKLEELRKLSDALDRANRAVQDVAHEHGENFRRLSIICGDMVLEHVARGRRAAKESALLGFEIFAERLAALQLGEVKLRDLFTGTREQAQYVHQVPSPPNLRLAWSDPTSGEARHYCDGCPAELASWHRVFAAQADELEASAKAARAELARTRKALKAAA